MIFGIPRETKPGENRVGLDPASTAQLTKLGHTVLIERKAGVLCGFSDAEYRRAGARMVLKRELFRRADLIVKVKEPSPEEYPLFREGQGFFGFLHLASSRRLTLALLKRKIIGFGAETLQNRDGTYPLLMAMSEIAGKLSVQIGSHFLEKNQGGRGVLLSGTSQGKPGKVVILGGGTVGKNAAEMALGMGARVVLFDIDSRVLRSVQRRFKGVQTVRSSPVRIARELREADLVIGAVLVSAARAPVVVTRKMVRRMPKGSVIVDVAIDQGGCVETSVPTTHRNPVREVYGVLHYGVPNIPSLVPRTATTIMSRWALPALQQIGRWGIEEAIQKNAGLRSGVQLWRGEVVNRTVADSLRLPYHPLPPL